MQIPQFYATFYPRRRSKMIDKFLLYLQSLNMSENTILSYGRDVGEFLKFIESRDINVPQVTQGTLLQFLEYLSRRKLKGNTRRRKMEAVKTFYRGMQKMGELERDPFHSFQDMPRTADAPMRVLTEAEYRTLRDVVRSSRRKTGIRDYAILELALQTGLRRSEICSLTLNDAQFSTKTTVGHVTVRKGKGGKHRRVVLNSPAEKALKEYLAVRSKGTPHQEVFLSNRLKPCTPVVMSRIFKRYMEKAGIQGASFHSLRHTFATHSLRKGTNIIVVQEALGHKSLTTTQKYLHFLQEMMEKQMTKNAL